MTGLLSSEVLKIVTWRSRGRSTTGLTPFWCCAPQLNMPLNHKCGLIGPPCWTDDPGPIHLRWTDAKHPFRLRFAVPLLRQPASVTTENRPQGRAGDVLLPGLQYGDTSPVQSPAASTGKLLPLQPAGPRGAHRLSSALGQGCRPQGQVPALRKQAGRSASIGR